MHQHSYSFLQSSLSLLRLSFLDFVKEERGHGFSEKKYIGWDPIIKQNEERIKK